MIKHLSASELRRNLGEVVKRVHSRREQVVIERGGIPVAALIDVRDFERLRRLQALEQLGRLGRGVSSELQRRGISDEDALRRLEEVKQEVFREIYGDLKA